MKTKVLSILKSILPVILSGVLIALFVSAPVSKVLGSAELLLTFGTLMCAGCLYFLLKDRNAPILSPLSALTALVLTIVAFCGLQSLASDRSDEVLGGMEYALITLIQGIYFGVLLLFDLAFGVLSVIVKKRREGERKKRELLLSKTLLIALGSAGLFLGLAALVGKDGLSGDGMFFLAAVASLQTAAFNLLMARELHTWRAVILSCSVFVIVGVVCAVLVMVLFEGAEPGVGLGWYCALSFGVLALCSPLFVLSRREKQVDTK